MPWLVVFAIGAIPIAAGSVFVLGWSYDWSVFDQIRLRLAEGTLYSHDARYNFAWSPAAAALIALVVVPLGFNVWFAAHAVALGLLRDRRLIALAVFSLPTWVDAGLGNTVTFAFVAGALAMRGSRWAELAYLALFVLIPRPLTLPLAAWLLWQRPRTRMPFLTMAGVVAITAVGSGYGADWVAAVVPMTSSHVVGDANAGPTRLLGMWWMAAGVPLAIWLTARKHFGLAGLAITPYLFPQYLLLVLWDFVPRQTSQARETEPASRMGAAWLISSVRRTRSVLRSAIGSR